MGKSNDQVTGYRYFTNLLLFIGNPIEKMLGINFDKRGWIDPFTDKDKNILDPGVINSPTLYGENEGGVAGTVYLKTGTNEQEVVPFYKEYMESIGLQASAYPYQSYLAFTGLGSVNTGNGFIDGAFSALAGYMNDAFYVGNSGYMKEMLLWPKRIHVKNDGSDQWYDIKSEIRDLLDIQKYNSGKIPLLNTHYYRVADIKNAIGDDFYSTDLRPSSFPGSLGTYDFSAPLADDMSLYFESSLDIVYQVHGYFYAYYEGYEYTEAEAKSAISSIGDLVGDIVVTRRSPDNTFPIYYDFSFNALRRIDGRIGASLKSPSSHYGMLLRINVDPSDKKIGYLDYSGDINPIHKIREVLTDDTAMNKPEASVNDVNFMKAAERIYEEGLGVSWSITEKSCIDAINELCYHIEAGIRVNRQTGLYEIVLFRDDWFEESEIHTIAENKIKKGSMQYEITNADEVINQVNVNYYDRANIKNSSFSISESGLIQTLGRVNAETVDFPYFMNMRNAEIVANWKLKILSTGVLKGSFSTGWREARKWNRYDLLRLPWSKRWSGTILVRIMSIKLGGPTNNEVSIEWVEVVPSTGMMNTTIVADESMNKPLPPQSCQYEPFELPYYLAVMALGQRKADEELAYESNFGLGGVVAEKPQENSLYAVMMTNNGDEWVRAGSIQYSVTADLDQIISKTSSSFTVKNWKKISNVPAGTLIKCGRDWLGTPGEWMVLQSIDPYTGIVSVKRGSLDTLPQEWGVDTKLYFCGNDVSYDQTEYVSGEEVLVSALTTTPSGVLEQGGSIPIEMKARAIRPYPPANVKINGEYFPDEIETDLVLTWVDRNRSQQTGGSIMGWYEGGVALESDVTYQLVLVERDVSDIELRSQNINLNTLNTYTFPTSAMDANTRTIEITLKSLRNSYECYQPFNCTVNLSEFYSAPYNLSVVFKND